MAILSFWRKEIDNPAKEEMFEYALRMFSPQQPSALELRIGESLGAGQRGENPTFPGWRDWKMEEVGTGEFVLITRQKVNDSGLRTEDFTFGFPLPHAIVSVVGSGLPAIMSWTGRREL